jgi:hypothetical protein
VPDRDLLGRLPEIELADLARPIDRALKRARRIKQRPRLAQVIVEIVLPPSNPSADQLTDPLPRHPPVGLQQSMDLVLERI